MSNQRVEEKDQPSLSSSRWYAHISMKAITKVILETFQESLNTQVVLNSHHKDHLLVLVFKMSETFGIQEV